MAFELETALASFWEARGRGDFFPAQWRDRLDYVQAYQVQLGLIARRCAAGERQVGWKVGLTSPAIQRQFGFAEPVFGCLLADGRKPSGHVFGATELIEPGFQVELCLRMGAPPRRRGRPGPGTTGSRRLLSGAGNHRDARRFPRPACARPGRQCAAEGVRAGRRGADDPGAGFVARGSAGADQWRGSGERTRRGRARRPAEFGRRLARKLAEFGRSLRAGDLIMSGSFTRQFPLAPGDHARAEFSGIGTVETRVAA